MIAGVSISDFWNAKPWEILSALHGFLQRQKANDARAAKIAVPLYANVMKNPRRAWPMVQKMFFPEKSSLKKPKTLKELQDFRQWANDCFAKAKEKRDAAG